MTSAAVTWGSTSVERSMPFPCDAHLVDADTVLFRAIHVKAPPAVVFRWLCQLRVAPYSYDWIDNFGDTSPRELTPGVERLERGQVFMTIFTLADFEDDRHITLRLTQRGAVALFGEIAASYVVLPATEGSRIVAKLRIRTPKFARALRSKLLTLGDFIMMRKQLGTLKALAEGATRPSATRIGERDPRSRSPDSADR
jgi:hypothetical protein